MPVHEITIKCNQCNSITILVIAAFETSNPVIEVRGGCPHLKVKKVGNK